MQHQMNKEAIQRSSFCVPDPSADQLARRVQKIQGRGVKAAGFLGPAWDEQLSV
jgi:hypothetical protein